MDNPSTQTGLAKPKRWLRFSLRTLLLLTAVVACWLGVQVNKAQKQRAVIAAIEELGGSVRYRKLNKWQWLWQPFDVTGVFLESNELTDEELGVLQSHLGNLPPLDELVIRSPYVTDEGIANLRELRSVYWLYLFDAPITDAGLLYIEQIPGLTGMSHRGTKTTWEGREDFRRRNRDIYLTE